MVLMTFIILLKAVITSALDVTSGLMVVVGGGGAMVVVGGGGGMVVVGGGGGMVVVGGGGGMVVVGGGLGERLLTRVCSNNAFKRWISV